MKIKITFILIVLNITHITAQENKPNNTIYLKNDANYHYIIEYDSNIVLINHEDSFISGFEVYNKELEDPDYLNYYKKYQTIFNTNQLPNINKDYIRFMNIQDSLLIYSKEIGKIIIEIEIYDLSSRKFIFTGYNLLTQLNGRHYRNKLVYDSQDSFFVYKKSKNIKYKGTDKFYFDKYIYNFKTFNLKYVSTITLNEIEM